MGAMEERNSCKWPHIDMLITIYVYVHKHIAFSLINGHVSDKLTSHRESVRHVFTVMTECDDFFLEIMYVYFHD